MSVPTGKPWTLAEIAALLELDYRGAGDTAVRGVATLAGAGAGDLSFLANPRYKKHLRDCRAAVVILHPREAEDWDRPCLLSDNPYLSFARFARQCQSRPAAAAGIHETAVVSADADIGAAVAIGAGSVIGAGCRIGAGTVIGSCVVLEPGAEVGEHCLLMSRCWLGPSVRLGRRVRVHPGAVLGGDGFGLAWSGEAWENVPQLGGLQIGDDCEVGANTCIDRGSIDASVLEDDVRLDNQIQIAHNVRIGAHTAIAACTGIAGSTTIGRRCLIGGGCGIAGHVRITDDVELTGMSMVTRSITVPGAYGSAVPAEPVRVWRRNMARLRRLDQLLRQLGKPKP